MEKQKTNENRLKTGITRTETGHYELGSLLFAPEELTLRQNGERVRLPYQEALLLRLLLEAPYHFVSQEKLAAFLWPDRLPQAIKCKEAQAMAMCRLRKSLRADPRIRVVCIRKIGYELSVEKE